MCVCVRVFIFGETHNDKNLDAALVHMVTGWPTYIVEANPALRELFSVRNEVSKSEDVPVKGSRIVIPQSTRDDILGRIKTDIKGSPNAGKGSVPQ